MTFQKINIPNGQSALAGLVLYQPWTVTIRKFGLSSVSFLFKKSSIFFILIK